VKNIVETAMAAGDFKTLVTAAKVAGLDKTLSGKGPFTVLAPTDKAFEKVPKKTLEALLKNKKKLTEVLMYHVIPGRVVSCEVSGMKSAKTAGGGTLKISKLLTLKVNEAKVIKKDIKCSNGVIHVIDSVLMPN
jgi:uncharacterized surface protein with fasciclin (FAS1) repeats